MKRKNDDRLSRRLLHLLFVLALCLSLLPTVAVADGNILSSVPYRDADGKNQTCASAIAVSSLERNLAYGENTYAYELKAPDGADEAWYVVDTNITLPLSADVGGDTAAVCDLYIQGDIHLILQDNCTLTINGSIRYLDTGIPNSLTIYGQENGTGMLSVTREDRYQHAVWMDGDVTINGGIVNITKTTAADLGEAQGAYGIQTIGKVNINGGTVNVKSEQPYNEAEGIVGQKGINITGGSKVEIVVRGYAVANGMRSSQGDISISGKASVTIEATADSNSDIGSTPRGILCINTFDKELASSVTISDTAELNITGNIDGGYTGCNSINDLVTRGTVTVGANAAVNAIATRGDAIGTNVSPEDIETIDVYGSCVAHGITVPKNATMTIQNGASLALRRGSQSDIYGKVVGGEKSIKLDDSDNSGYNVPVIRVYNGGAFPVSAVGECNLMYEITKELTNLTAISSNTFAAAGELSASSYEETLNPASGYQLPKSIRVTISGTEFTGHGYDPATGTFSIDPKDVTGPVVVTAYGVMPCPLSTNSGVTADVTHVSLEDRTITLTAAEGKYMPATIKITTGNAEFSEGADYTYTRAADGKSATVIISETAAHSIEAPVTIEAITTPANYNVRFGHSGDVSDSFTYGETPISEAVLYNTGNCPIKIWGIDARFTAGTVTIAPKEGAFPVTVNVGESVPLTVQPIAVLTVGNHQTPITVKYYGADDAALSMDGGNVIFTVAKKNLTNEAITLMPTNPAKIDVPDAPDIPDHVYTGSEIKPTIKFGNVTLIEGTDYTAEYANNINAGNATVTLSFTGNYEGTVEKTFEITKAIERNDVRQ